MALRTHRLACGYGKVALLSGIDLSLQSGGQITLLGPNGIGKTTLFRTLLGLLPALNGQVLLDGNDVQRLSPVERARTVAFVPQATELTFPYSAFEVALMGRAPWLRLLERPSARDYTVVEDVFESLSLQALAPKPFVQLSSGERQLVLIARALVQSPRYLILDEPTSNLDFGNQYLVTSVIRRLRERGLGVLMTTHHPNQVFESSGCVMLIDSARQIHLGEPDTVLTTANLKAAYGVDVTLESHRGGGGTVVRYCVSGTQREQL